MQFSRVIRFWIPLLVMTVSLWSCANIGRPSGGDKDERGPEVLGVLPYPGTLFFNYKEIQFHFDEFIKPGNYTDEVFISPVPPVDPEVIVKNKVLTIKFLSPLRENTTYVITLGTGIADFNENNKMEKSYTYAFSTGAILDSLNFKGQITDMWSGTPEKDMKVMLFRQDDIAEKGILNKRPEYLVTTGKAGEFEFKYLAPGRYKVFGVGDANNDSRYSGVSEKIALAADPLVSLSGQDSVAVTVSMTSFLQDIAPPKLKSAKWSNAYTIHLEFSDEIKEYSLGDSLRIEMIDTTNGSTKPLTIKRFRSGDQSHLFVAAAFPKNRDYKLHITNMMDSLGHRADTILVLAQQSIVKEEKGRWYEAPVNQRRGHELVIPAMFAIPATLDSTQITLLDSAGVYQPDVEWSGNGMEIKCKPLKMMKVGVEYKVRLLKRFPLPDGKNVDSSITFRVSFPNPDDFGTVTGIILPDSLRPNANFSVIYRGAAGSWVLTHPRASQKENKGKSNAAAEVGPDRFQARFKGPGPFHFVYLSPGKYTIDIIDDVDGNGVATPGSLEPYRMPEKVYHESNPIEIKAKWDLKDVEVYPVPQNGKGKAAATKGASNDQGGGGKKLGK